MSASPAIAVLMTCHNRRDLTLRCLASLAGQAHFDPANLFLVDDGSSDGTGDAVREAFPAANIVQGDGSLFWNGGMRAAWDAAKASGRAFDYYLWLNDDVVLAQGALAMLVDDARASARADGAVIVAGATTEPGAETITYGAHRRPDPRRPLRLALLAPAGRPIAADSISGNVVLVSAAVERVLGNLEPRLTHIYGDIDYALRARKAGIPVLLASRPAGTCAANSQANSSLDRGMSRGARLAARWREDGKLHARDWRQMVRLHGGGAIAAFAHRLMPYLRILTGRDHTHAGRVINSESQP